jgi:TonB family protein
MRCVFAVAPLFVLAWLPAVGQQDALATRPDGAGLIAPVLLPPTLTISTPKRCDELDGVVRFAATIDSSGLPHELNALAASDRRLIAFATELVEAQRFKPGTINGSNVAVAIRLTVGLHTCAQRERHPTGDNFYRFTLRAHPLIVLAVAAPPAAQKIVSAAPTADDPPEQVGGAISAPIPTVITDPEIPISRKLQKRGVCLLGVTIDSNGAPRDIHVVRSLDPEFDSGAVEAAKSWRFKPALRDGSVPVAVEGTVAANFEYVDKKPVAFATFIPEAPERIEIAKALREGKQIDVEPLNGDEVIARYLPVSRVAGRCLVALLIDKDGVPQNVHIVKGLESSVDLDTVAMVEHLRFKPLLQDGTTPVTVGLVIPVRYRTRLEKPTWRDVFFLLAEIPIIFFL